MRHSEAVAVVRRAVTEAGGLLMEWGTRSAPSHIAFFPRRVILMEIEMDRGIVPANKLQEMERLKSRGHKTEIITSEEDVERVVAEIGRAEHERRS